MAIGNASNIIIRPEFFNAGLRETLDQNVDVFNANSGGALELVTEGSTADFQKTRFVDRFSNLSVRRDDTSNSSVTPQALTQTDDIDVRVKRRTDPIQQSVDSIRDAGLSREEMSVIIGNQAGEDIAADYTNTAVLCLVAALQGQSETYLDKSGSSSNTLDNALMNEGLGKFGDRRQALSVAVMHSKPFEDLVGNNVSASGDQVEFATIYNNDVGSFGRTVIVTDSDELVNTDGISAGTDSYYTLLLQEMAFQVQETRTMEMFEDLKTGNENVTVEMQGEHDFTLSMKGFSWDETNGGRNPTDSALGTGSNWDSVVGNFKDFPGVVVEHA